ncbi:MAG: AAA family ATPase [Candidatus Hydrogenedentes bacterium]|nr:AAA family ATPase [Candidatus Hydrogenedentota bacterium]
MSTANYCTALDALELWRDDVLTGAPPVLYPVGRGELERIEIGPGLVTLLGGAPGAGKTALAMQFVIDGLRLTPGLRALVCNIEMRPAALLDRQLARLSGIDLTTIRYRRFGPEHADRLDQAINTLAALADRLCFVRPPFDLGNAAASADAFGANLLVLDYIQRIAPPGDHADKRGSVDATMNYLRQFADAGVAVLVISAVGRGKDRQGRSSYDADALSLASFRESSELEFGADSAYIIAPDGGHDDAGVTLRHLKDRHGELRDFHLRFDRKRQSLTIDAMPETKAKRTALQSTLRNMWAPAGNEESEP